MRNVADFSVFLKQILEENHFEQLEQADKLRRNIKKKHEGHSLIKWTNFGDFQQDLEDFKVEEDGVLEIFC